MSFLGKLVMYESMKKSVIRVFDDGLVQIVYSLSLIHI